MSRSSTQHATRTLLITNASGDCTEHVVVEGRSVFLGSSSSDCGIHVDETDVDQMHCLVSLDEGLVFIQNWSSSAGTIIDGQEIDSRVEISDTDSVVIGSVSMSLKPIAGAATAPSLAPVQNIFSEPDGELGSQPSSDDRSDASDLEIAPNFNFDQSLDDVAEQLAAIDDHADDLEQVTDQVIEEVAVGVTEQYAEQYTERASEEVVDSPPAEIAVEVVEVVDVDDVDDVEAIESIDAELNEAAAAELEASVAEPTVSNSGWGNYIEDDDLDVGVQYDQETVDLLKAEIEELRAMLAGNDHSYQLDAPIATAAEPDPPGDDTLQRRVDELLAEAEEHDEKVEILSELLEAAEYKDQTEREERQALEAWVGEIEQRISQRETEWQAELDSLQQQLQDAQQERDDTQRDMRQVAARYDAPEVYQETLDRLQTRNAELESECEAARKQSTSLQHEIDSAANQESADICETRAMLAKERAQVSRMQFELSRKLSEFNALPEPQSSDDAEFTSQMRDLRAELRAMHEIQRREREEQGDSLLSRISGLWKRADEY